MQSKFLTTALLSIAVFVGCSYGAIRLYYFLTDGFEISHITSDLPYDARWNVRPLQDKETQTLMQVFAQPYFYMGKWCQVYVFASADGKYVIKFFKYQCF